MSLIKFGCLCPTCINHHRRLPGEETPSTDYNCDGDCGNGDRDCDDTCQGAVQGCGHYQEVCASCMKAKQHSTFYWWLWLLLTREGRACARFIAEGGNLSDAEEAQH